MEPLLALKDVSEHWIERMLSQEFGTPVMIHSWNCEAPEVQEGFMSEITYLEVEYSRVGGQRTNLSLVIKILPTDPERKETIANIGMAKREILFYKFVNTQDFKGLCLKSNIIIHVPKVYLASYVDGDVTLVMENLKTKGYKSGIVKEGNTLAQTKVAVQAIAQFHAVGLAYLKEFGEESILAPLAEEIKFICFDFVFVRNLPPLAEMCEGTAESKSMLSLLPYTKDIIEMRKRYPLMRTIVHGDYWAGQLMYSEDESKVMMIDWQHCHVGNPSSDILSLLFMSCHPKILEDHLDEVLQSYWEAFTCSVLKLGISLEVTYEQFRKNIDDLMLFGFMLLGISIPEFLDGGNLTRERLLSYVTFLDRKEIVSNFVKMMEGESKKSQ